MTNAKETYLAANDAMTLAFNTYDPVRRAYHAGKVLDVDYLAARATYNSAMDVFDKAWLAAAKAKVI